MGFFVKNTRLGIALVVPEKVVLLDRLEAEELVKAIIKELNKEKYNSFDSYNTSDIYADNYDVNNS